MKTTITSMAIALLFAVTANADVIHTNDYEGTTATGFGVGFTSTQMDFTDGGGDLIGFSANGNALNTGDALGLSDANPNSGSFHYAVDVAQTTAAGNGWGASWTGMSSISGNTTGGFGEEADVIAAGTGSYISYTEGATFTVSAMIATDAANPLTGSGTAAPRLEFQDAGGVELFRNQSAIVDATTISDTYQLISHTYTLTAADEALGIARVVGVLGTDGNGDAPGNSGMVYYDDFVFEVDGAFVTTLNAVPEPSSAVILAGLLGLCGLRRKKN